MHILESTNLEFSIGSKKILDGISVQFRTGELVGILGPNGSGKTTLLRNLYGVAVPQQGNIFLDQQNIHQLKSKELAKKIAVLPQNTVCDFAFTCEEIVRMGRYPYHGRFQFQDVHDQDLVSTMLRKTGVEFLKDRFVNEMSGGELQRVLLARALVQTQQFLLLDEPISHLDIHHQIEILELLQQLKKEIGIVMTLHDLNFASRYCDRIILIQQGKIVADGTPVEVLKRDLIQKVFQVQSQILFSEEKNISQLMFYSEHSESI